MPIVAITGGFGTGKTTVTRMFNALGARLVDVDNLVHELEQPRQKGWQKIVALFGKKFLLPNQQLDRKKLAKLVFSTPAELKKLNRALHPLVLQETKRRIQEQLKKNRKSLIAVDIPLLFEVGEQANFDFVVVVLASESRVLKRLKTSRHLLGKEIKQRIRAQIPLEKKANQASFVVDNNNGLSSTKKQVKQIFQSVFSDNHSVKKLR